MPVGATPASNGDPNDKSELVGAASTLVAGLIAGKFAGQRPSGTGTVFKWPGEAPGGHFSVLVEGAGEAMHTHQVITGPGQATTIAQVAAGELGVPSATVKVPLANPAGAMAYQRSVVGAPGGQYHPLNNNCAQHCANVLNAGGSNVPTGTRALLVWWSAQIGKTK
ncbi:MAG: hypothetical protein R3B36_33205 [Polyangiaceae bacterium]